MKNAHTLPKLSIIGQKTHQLLYWPIYSLNYSQLPNQYSSKPHVKTLIE